MTAFVIVRLGIFKDLRGKHFNKFIIKKLDSRFNFQLEVNTVDQKKYFVHRLQVS